MSTIVLNRQNGRSLVSSTSRSVAKLQALADARAASQEAQYTRLIAEKELERRTRDAEAERIRQQEKARYEKELKILGADKKAAVANAKLKVFEEALLEQELERDSELPSLEVPGIKNEERTSQWVHSSPTLNPLPADYRSRPRRTQNPQIPKNNQSLYRLQQYRKVNLSFKIFQIRKRNKILPLIESQLSH